jgi:Fe-S-cluster-containing hydrogenase component 2
MQFAAQLGRPLPRRPWLMVSVNDQEDLHFRKASFDATRCPADCPRPCEVICPTRAIPPVPAAFTFDEIESGRVEGVAEQGRCYGCGRCLTMCPLGLIEARPYQLDAAAVLTSLAGRVDALEIHTNASSFSLSTHDDHDPFHQLCARLRGPASEQLKLISVSFPFLGEAETTAFLRHRSQLLAGLGAPVPAAGAGTSTAPATTRLRIWQTDGRPMSGDIGNGTTLSCVRFGEVVLRARALPFHHHRQHQEDGETEEEEEHHFLQLAGGTNAYTAEKLEVGGLLSPLSSLSSSFEQEGPWVHGLAFGGFARKEVDRAMAARGLGLEDAVDEHPEVREQG